MGQRHQIYVVQKKDNKYLALGAYHHQWCYGLTAASNLCRLVELTKKALGPINDFKEYALNDERLVNTLVTSIYGVNLNGYISMVHNENEYLIENGIAKPECGDNNDGATLLVIDLDKREVRGCLFTPGHVEGEFSEECKKWTSYTPKQYLNFYYRDEKLKEMLKSNKKQADYIKVKVNPVFQLEFNKIFKNSIKKRK